MNILQALIDSLSGTDTPVRSVCAGAFWTAVTTRHTGLAATCRDADTQHSDTPGLVADAGDLVGIQAGELAAYARSVNTVAASIGVAAINSLLDVDESQAMERGAFDLLAEKGAGRDIAVVGHFPFIPQLRAIARTVWVIEKRLRPGDFADSEAEKFLPKADVVCLTGTALINHTLEGLLSLCRDRYVVLTGPSSPLAPVLFDFGISAICGARVTRPDEAIRYISQAACFKQLKGHGVRLLTLQKK